MDDNLPHNLPSSADCVGFNHEASHWAPRTSASHGIVVHSIISLTGSANVEALLFFLAFSTEKKNAIHSKA